MSDMVNTFSRAAGSMSSELATGFAAEFVLPSSCSSFSTRQAITYASVCFPPQCIFPLLSNRIFNSDTNTSYARILCIPFTSCPDGRHFFPPLKQNSRKENIRSWEGAGKVSSKGNRTLTDKIGACRAISDSARSQDVLSGLVGGGSRQFVGAHTYFNR